MPYSHTGRAAYGRHLKPRVNEMLAALNLDVLYHRAEGDHLYYRDESGRELKVLDLLGGYGANLLGHNHPEILAVAKDVLDNGRPFLAQASMRGPAGLLAKRLGEAVGRTTGRGYVVTLANTGAEAVEAAIKHAELECRRRHRDFLARVKKTAKEVRIRLREHTAFVPDDFLERSAGMLGLPRIDDLDELFLLLYRHNMDRLDSRPAFLALSGGFHGKTTGALNLTFNPDYRSDWQRIGLHTEFLPVGELAALAEAIHASTLRCLDLRVDEDGVVRVEETDFTNISGLFVEPVQGEGGIRVIPADYLKALRRAADGGGFPLVFDEIQCGLGRTGTFLASEPSGVRADYYLFSKALGGGLAKVSALLVDRERYLEDFGYVHTSTFAEDDFSSTIALAVLDILERKDGALARGCLDKGLRLLERLQELRGRFPDVLREVRGRGLMLGVELASQARSPSPLIRVLSEQDLLAYVVCGLLLREHGIRVMPTLSNPNTLRIEPSALVPEDELDRFVDALQNVLAAIRDADACALVRNLVGKPAGALPRAERVRRAPPDFTRPDWAPRRFSRKIAFLAHFMEPSGLRDWDPSLAPFDDRDCEAFLDRTRGRLEPFVVERKELHSTGGETVSLAFIGIAFTPEQVMRGFKTGEAGWAVELIEKAVALAKRLGCSVAGLGGYTSILTDNCRLLVEDDVALTSGNALTAAAALDALWQAAAAEGLPTDRLAVVGATGNLGAVLAQAGADRATDILLVGRAGARPRLEREAAEVYFSEWKRLTRQDATDGLAGLIAGTETVRALRRDGARGVARIGEAIRDGLKAELGEDRAPVRVAADLAALRGCPLIVSATNSPKPVILPEHLGDGPALVCDVAVPRDVDPRVLTEKPGVKVLKGGLVKVPLGQTLDIPGMPLPAEQIYGCLAETILLGFAGVRMNFSYGKLTAEQVRRVHELARMHGFKIEPRWAEA